MAGKFSAFSLILFTLPNCSFKGGKIQKMETSVFQQKYQKEGPFLFPNGSWHCHFHSPLKQPKQRIHRVEERYFQTWATSLICIHNAFLFPIIIVAKLALHANEQLCMETHKKILWKFCNASKLCTKCRVHIGQKSPKKGQKGTFFNSKQRNFLARKFK